MSKDDLIQELVKARIAEDLVKKGYEVKVDSSIIIFFNEQIPAYSLDYMTPKQFREAHTIRSAHESITIDDDCPAILGVMSKISSRFNNYQNQVTEKSNFVSEIC